MKLCELLREKEILSISKNTDMSFSVTPTRDTENLQSSSLLFLLRPAMKDYPIFDASNINCFGIVADEEQRIVGDARIIRVKNARLEFSYALLKYYGVDCEKIKLVGVTGTNGKTTTASLIYGILNRCGHKSGFIGTGKIEINGNKITDCYYSMTTPDPEVLYPALRKMQDEGCEYCIMEVSSHALSLHKVAPLYFECGIFTNLSEEHMDYHRTMEDYFQAKLMLLRNCKACILNIDDEYCRKAIGKTGTKELEVGIIRQGEVYATDITYSGLDGACFLYREKDFLFKAETKLTGPFNIYNSLMALACVIRLGIKPHCAKMALKTIPPIEGRMEIYRDTVTVIIDYAHTPVAIENSLKTIKSTLKPGQRLITVFGCGGERDSTKRPVMAYSVASLSDYTVITEDNSRNENFLEILSDIEKGIPSGASYTVIEKRDEAILCAILRARQNDVIAILGKGHEKYIVGSSGKRYFDERIIVQSALAARRRMRENESSVK